ncbi:hypothetical protein HF086_001442 [Spodoptera exigua]|uniref:Uncharacterized protein n=1 Tax=Spodoptera exigua TaxID=7107 RepID=A0A922MFB5_SPOEX|nr:hypothetical protein HF086_001442 [Spodoptera exigua]
MYRTARSRSRFTVDGHTTYFVESPETAHNSCYHELPTLEDSTTSIMGSEPNIYNMKLKQDDNIETQGLKSHNSDSEILRLNDEQSQSKVLFTLGGESTIDLNGKLVRMSTNNQDEMDESVKKICSEISDFCSIEKVHEGLDIAKHLGDDDINIAEYLESKASVDDVDPNCADVIVIPSAEAILDTGQEVKEIEEEEK